MLLVTIRMDGVLVHRGVYAPGTQGRVQGIVTGPRTMKLFRFSSAEPTRIYVQSLLGIDLRSRHLF